MKLLLTFGIFAALIFSTSAAESLRLTRAAYADEAHSLPAYKTLLTNAVKWVANGN